MSEVLVRAERDYVVEVGSDWLISLKNACENRQRVALIISDAFKERFSDLELGNCEVFTFAIGDGEAGKSSETLLKVWSWLGAAGFTRSDLIVGIGGGAVTDFAGFAAATWLRGLDFVSPALVQEIAPDVLRHRIGLTYEAEAKEITADKIVAQVIATTPIPAA